MVQVFHYSGMGFPPPGHFRDHVVWSGDVMKKDVSLTLLRVSPRFCGTYICQVHNTPEITGRVGEISLRVVNKTASKKMSLMTNDVSVWSPSLMAMQRHLLGSFRT